MKLAVFASGNGSNFTAIHEAIQEGEIQAEISFLFCDHPTAKVIERANKANVLTYSFELSEFENKHFFEQKIVEILEFHEVDLVVLAGYMRLVSPTLLTPFKNRIINIHPSLLPKYPGIKSIRQSFDNKDPYGGVTIHFIDEGMDTGPIIAQQKVERLTSDSLESFEQRIHEVEHELYPKVLQQIIQERG